MVIADATGLSKAEADALEQELRAAALAIAGVAEARVAMTVAEPARTLIAIGSGKGGVGKSTVAANLAIALARAGKKVGLVDADIYGPSQPTLLGSDAKPTAEDDRLIPVAAHGLKFLSLGQLVSPGHALAWRGPMATGALAKLIEADWGDAELLLVDLPPGHRRRSAVADPALAAGRRGDRLDSAGPVADRRARGRSTCSTR